MHLFAKNFHLNNMSYIIQHIVHCRCKQGRASEVYFLVRNQMSAPATNERKFLGLALVLLGNKLRNDIAGLLEPSA